MTKDGSKIERMLDAGSNLDKAREVFAAAIKHRPRIRLTIRQRIARCWSSGRRHDRPQRFNSSVRGARGPLKASGSRGVRTVVVCPTASEVLFHLGDRLGNGVSIMAPRGLQISSPNQFGDHLTGSYPEGGLNDLVHGLKVQATGRLRRCRAINRRSNAPQRAASLTLVGALSFAGVT